MLRPLIITIALCVGLLAMCPSLPAAAGAAEGLAFIAANQMPDGGFAEPGRTEGADSTTAWCIMAIRAGGADPNAVKSGGRSPVDFLDSQSGSWRSVTDYERTLLAVAAAGRNIRSFGGIDLLAKVQSYQRTGGNIGDAINSNAFGMLSYRVAGLAVPPGAVEWHVRNQNGDGGWGNSPGSASNPDMTAASIMALRAAGVNSDEQSIKSALAYLRSIQNGDGGFSFERGSSDVSATAWCVQAIVAAGQDPAGGEWSKNGNTPYGFIASMQAGDGRFYWMDGADKNPVWTTAYAVCAMARKPYPIGISYSDPPGGGGSGESAGDTDGGPAASPTGPAGGGEGQANSGGEAGGGPEAQGETPAQDTGVQAADEGKSAEEHGASQAAAESEDRGAGSSEGTSFLVWLIPLMVAVPLLSLGGWLLYRRFG
ncbi:MAG: prenyltransferase/squalene oxidase repeat-containing protein [Actinomycetota bacterium]